MPEVLVGGVDLQGVDGALLGHQRVDLRVGGLAVGRRHQDALVQLLQGPAVVHEAHRQPVEQLGVRGLLRHVAEVVGGRDDAGAEVMEPDAVDEHAGRQRVGAVGDGQRQLPAAAAFVEGLAVGAGEDLEELARGDGALLVAVAAQVDVGVAGLLGVGDGHRGAGAARVRQVEGVDGLEPEEARRDVAVLEGRGGLPGLAEGAGGDEHRHLGGRGDILVVGRREGVGRQLGDGLVVLLAALAGGAAHLEVRHDTVMLFHEQRVVGEGDVIEGLRFEVAQGLRDERVDRELLVGQRGGEDGGGLLGELGLGHRAEAGQRTGDGRVGADHHRAVHLAVDDVLVLVLLLHVVALLGTDAAGERDHGAGAEALMQEGKLAADVLVVAADVLVHVLAKLLLVVGADGGGGGAGPADDRVDERVDGGGEDAVQGVVVGGGDRVELVVVAAGAGDGQAEEALGRRVDALVDRVVVVVEALAHGDEAERGEARVVLGQVGQAVGRELLDDELVVRLVGVERVDDVVAVGPGVGGAVALGAAATQALGVGVTGGIEPVAGPALAVARRGEQAVDGAFEHQRGGAGGLAVADRQSVADHGGVEIAGEGVGLGVGGRQAVEVVGEAAQQRLAVGGGIGLEAHRVELGQDE